LSRWFLCDEVTRVRVLVTGGAGFIGSHLAEALVRRGHRVRVLDNFYSGKRGNLRAVAREVEVLKGDCADLAVARRAARGMEAVLHEAAIPSVARSVADPALSHRANATATLSMLVAARDAGVGRFVYAGSSSVYGDRAGRRKREDMDPRPLSPYAVGKLTGEHYTRIFASLYAMETVTLRYFNVFGPRQDAGSPYSGVISLFITAMLAGRTPVLYGDGAQSRDFTYIDNVVDGNLRALSVRGLEGQSINVATGRSVTLNALLKALARLLRRPAHASRRPPRPGDIRHSLADVTLARKVLGYRPLVDFETGLEQTVDWYRRA
jgi:UDP-glucose 4-epimerase